MSLQAYYKMNTGWTDASGNGYDGTPNGAVINSVDQKLGAGCGAFLTNDEVTFPSFYNPSGTTEFSLMGWIKSDAGTAQKGIYGSWNNINDSLWMQSNTGGDGLYFFLAPVSGSVSLDTTSDYIHVAFVFDGAGAASADKMKIYSNSISQSLSISGSVPTTIPTITTAPTLGRVNGLARYWDGLLDNIEIYSHALTQSEIDEDYNGGAGREIGSGGNIRKKKLMERYNA